VLIWAICAGSEVRVSNLGWPLPGSASFAAFAATVQVTFFLLHFPSSSYLTHRRLTRPLPVAILVEVGSTTAPAPPRTTHNTTLLTLAGCNHALLVVAFTAPTYTHCLSLSCVGQDFRLRFYCLDSAATAMSTAASSRIHCRCLLSHSSRLKVGKGLGF